MSLLCHGHSCITEVPAIVIEISNIIIRYMHAIYITNAGVPRLPSTGIVSSIFAYTDIAVTENL